TSDFVGLVDTEGNIHYMNPSGRKMLGLTDNQDIIGTNLAKFHPEDTIRFLQNEVLPKATEEGVWKGELTFQTAKGKNIPTSTVMTAHKDTSGKIEYFSTISRDISEEKRTLATLEKEQHKLELAMLAGDVGFWHYHPPKRHLDISHRWLQEKLGYSKSRLQDPEIWLEIIHNDDLERVLEHFNQTKNGNANIFEEDLRLKKQDGTYLWIHSRAKVIRRDQANEVKEISGIHVDIDERKRIELELRQEQSLQNLLRDIRHNIEHFENIEEALEESLKNICDYINWPFAHIYTFDEEKELLETAGVWHLEASNKTPFVEASLKTTFYPGEGLVGKVYDENIPYWVKTLQEFPDYKRRKSVAEVFSSCICIPVKGDPSAVIEFYHSESVDRDQQVLNHLMVIAKQLGYLLERRKSRKEIADRERKFRYLAENATDKVAIYDAEANCVYASPSTETLLGYTPEEYLEKDIIGLVHPDDRPAIRTNITALLEGKGKERITYRLKHKDGHYIWVENNLNPLYDKDGSVIEIHSAARDISDRVKYQQDLQYEKEFTDKALNSLPGLFYVLDKDGNYVRLNEGFVEEVGYTREEIKQMNPLEFYHEEDHQRISE
ncbi:PAS domain S-box protein, partial [Fodinibius sediminis]